MVTDGDATVVSPPRLKRAWRIVTWAGLLGSIYYLACVSGAPRIKFLTELGATAFDFGLIAGLASVAISFQILGSLIGNRIRHRKPVWMALAITHRVIFLCVLLAPLLFSDPRLMMVWILAVFFCSDALTQTSVPIWFSWMADLVPKESMTRHWATRQRFITLANIGAMVAIAFGFHYFEVTGRIVEGFTILASAGVLLGLIDIFLFLGVPEPSHERTEGVRLSETLVQPLRDAEFRPFLIFMAVWHFAVFTAAPFFGLYMIDHLGLNVMTVQLLGTASALGVALASGFWGLLCDGFGYRSMLQVLTLAKSLTPLAFFLVPLDPRLGIPFLAVVMFIDGALNAGMMLAMQNPLLKATPRRNRTMYIAAANFFAVGIMGGIAPVISGRLVDFFNQLGSIDLGLISLTGYHGIFAVSMLLRFGASFLASRIHEPHSVPWRSLWRHLRPRRIWRVTRMANRLQDSDKASERLGAARELGQLCNPMAIGELIQALQDEDRAVREASADALGSIGAMAAAGPLAQALFSPESGIQPSAARALGRIRSVDSLRALLRNLTNLESEALGDTIDSLAEHENEAALLPLICLFNEVEDETLRNRIAQALGKLTQTENVEEVTHMLLGRRPLNQQVIK